MSSDISVDPHRPVPMTNTSGNARGVTTVRRL